MVCILDKRNKPLLTCSLKRARPAKEQSRLERVLRQARQPLNDATRINATRWALDRALQLPGLPASVGNMDRVVEFAGSKQSAFDITAYGRGAYQRTRLPEDGFLRGTLMRSGSVPFFHAGAQVKARVPKASKHGTYLGRRSLRETGSTNLKTTAPTVELINHKHCRLIQLADGYGYHLASHFQHFLGRNVLAPRPEHRGLRA
jgi:hypothetical protein